MKVICLWPILALLTVSVLAIVVWRVIDWRADRSAWTRLITLGAVENAVYSPDIVANLPEPARRFFNYTIAPGTPIRRVAEIHMKGDLSLGTKGKPDYRPMAAKQLSVAPYGFVWSLKWGGVSGSDGFLSGKSWTRFWLFNIVPVVHASGEDHRRSSFGRMVADSVFWSPASMLPGKYVQWSSLGPDSARVKMNMDDLEQEVDVHVDSEGRPCKVVFQRWSNENPGKVYCFQPFGGDLSEFKTFQGYRLPTSVVAGNHYDTADYFPFFKATVTDVRFPEPRTRS